VDNARFVTGRYPGLRLRRNRGEAWSRALIREHRLAPEDLIWPLFVIEGRDKATSVDSMPGVERLSIDRAVKAAREAAELGIPALALFPVVNQDKKTEDGREAGNPDNLICRAVRAVKEAVPEI